MHELRQIIEVKTTTVIILINFNVGSQICDQLNIISIIYKLYTFLPFDEEKYYEDNWEYEKDGTCYWAEHHDYQNT